MRSPLLSFLAGLLLLPWTSLAVVDLDQDGWSDLWESLYGRGYSRDGDEDGDGRSNWQEHEEGTDPRDAASKLSAVQHRLLPRGGHEFAFSTVAGKTYQLEFSGDGNSWSALGAPVKGTGATMVQTLNGNATFLGTGPQLSRYTGLDDAQPLTAVKTAVKNKVPPAEEELLPTTETAQTAPDLNHFGQYLRGWLIPPRTGTYIFWVAGDDTTELALSTNSTPQRKKVIATNPTWTTFRNWTHYDSQKSAPVSLRAGQLYYFEFWSQEFGGGDHASLAWSGPGLAPDKEIILGAYVATSTETLNRRLVRTKTPQYRLRVSDPDTDGDGLTDFEETIAGLDPLNPKSISRVPDLQTVTGMFAATNVITVGAETSHGFEAEQQPARFTFFRTGNLNRVTAYFSLSGTAQTGVDYAPVSGEVTFGVGENSATVEIVPVKDGDFEQAETVVAQVQPHEGYEAGAPSSATVTLDDAAELVFVATMKPQDGRSSGYGSAGVKMAGNRAFADFSVSFGNLTSEAAAVEVIWQRPGQAPVVVLSRPPAQTPVWRWDLAGANGVSREQVIQALLAGQLAVRVNTVRVPGGEILAPLVREWGWKNMPVPARPGAALTVARTDGEAARFLMQASFGPTVADMAEVRRLGYAGWLETQFRKPVTKHLPYVQARRAELLKRSSNSDDGYQTPRQEAWWQAALTAPDQLRQRMALALSEIMVVSDVGVLESSHEGLANWYDMLLSHSFGNFRNLLQEVTLSPMMGQYLSMARNQKPNPDTGSEPDENYAREVMQLFTIGLNMLNRDGSLALGANGMPVPTYGQSDIVGLAHVFTGWGPAFPATENPQNRLSFYRYGEMPQLLPMEFYPEVHDPKAKRIVRQTMVPSNLTGPAEMKLALDTLFLHPNVAPFISRQLIQRLVTSNPSRGYIYRVASVFENNGAGVRGDLRATLRAILLDPEARNPVFQESESYGKLREPLLRVAAVMRAFRPAPVLAGDPRYFVDNQYNLPSQAALKSPSVFNFFQPGYLPPGRLARAGLYGPEFQITQEATAIAVTNVLHSLVHYGIWTREHDANDQTIYFRPDLEKWAAQLAAEGKTQEVKQGELIDRLNNLLLGGRMSTGLRQSIVDAYAALPTWFNTSLDRQRDRVRMALFIIVSSPEFTVQK